MLIPFFTSMYKIKPMVAITNFVMPMIFAKKKNYDKDYNKNCHTTLQFPPKKMRRRMIIQVMFWVERI